MRIPRLALVDYGMGNLRSAAKALERLGARVEVSSSPRALGRADGVVLPGVGAFGEAVLRLTRLRLFEPIRSWIREERPFLGICLGLQLLFEESEEFGRHRGMACFPGKVVAFSKRLRVPHMGWNRLVPTKRSWLLQGLPRRPYVYFVHSFFPVPANVKLIAARTDYGLSFASAIQQGPVAGVQFHPEKSQHAGLRLLKNFLSTVRRFK